MALIVETGAGVPNADAYSSMVWIDAYQASRGRTAWAASAEELKEAAVRRGTRSLDILFADRWPGQRTYGRAQSLAWPRVNVVTTEGDDLLEDSIPIELQEAAAEAAWIELNSEGVLIPTASEQIERSISVGPISVTYENGYTSSASRVNAYVPYLEKFLWNLLLEISASTGVQFLLRV